MVAPHTNIPTIFAAFGARGDLMRRKVIPAVYHLYTHGELPKMFRVVGFSRRDWSDAEFQAFIKEVVEEHQGGPVTGLQPFLELFKFQRGYFEEARSYQELKRAFDECDKEWGVCSNKLFYFSVAPEYYEMILRDISKYRLAEPCGQAYAERLRSVGAKGVGETVVSPYRRAGRSPLRTEGSQGEATGFDEGGTRVIVEKAFGIDSGTAK